MRLTFCLLTCAILGANAQMPNTLSARDKIYGLSKFWQEANYNFAYFENVDRNKWDSAYHFLIEEVTKTENDYEYYRLLQRFCAQLKDGHTNVYFPEDIRKKVFNTYFGDYRLFFTSIEGKAILTRINASKKNELPIGSELVRINGLATADYQAQFVTPYLSASTPHILVDLSVSKLLEGPIGTSYDLEFKLPDGSLKSLRLTHEETTEKEVYPPFDEPPLVDFKWVHPGMAYVALNSFSQEEIIREFQAILPELYQAKKLIVDLRDNGGGNTGNGTAILQYLTNARELPGAKMKSRLHIPAFKAWGTWVNAEDTAQSAWHKQAWLSYHDNYWHEFENTAFIPSKKIKRLVVPTVLLIGHNTASAAEDFLIYADGQKHMTKIGEPTYGSTGQPLFFDLLGGGSARICTKKDTYPDGKPFVGVGVLPDIEVQKTLEDYLLERDPALEKAVAFLLKRNP